MAKATDTTRSDRMQPPQDRAALQGSLGNGPRPRTLVISDIRLLREGLMLAIRQNGRLEVVAAAETAEALATAVSQRPDVVLLDAGATGGREMPRLLKDLIPGVPVVVFAIADGDPDILGWAEAGTSGYVGRDGTIDDVVGAVEGAMRGEVFCSPRLTGLLFARVAQLADGPVSADNTAKLTPRERDVMALVGQGLPNKEIARHLGIGHATVKNHVHHILEKMHAGGRGEAAARIRHGGAAAPGTAAAAKPRGTSK